MSFYDSAMPYTNIHELNLDWVIKVVKEYLAKVDTLEIDFNDLKNYVDNYFESTDFAQLVNDKIDELVDSGDFTTMFATYTTRIYDTVSQMVADTLLVDGSHAQTLGYYNANDNGGAKYLIMSTTPTGYYETLSNGLYAELIMEDEMNVEVFGAYGDGATDDSTALATAMLYANKIMFSPKTYLFSTQIFFKEYKDVYLVGNNTIFKGLDLQLNTEDGITWYIPYNSRAVRFSGIRFENDGQTTCLNVFQPVELINCIVYGYDNFLTQSSYYIDKLTLKEIEVRNKGGSDYTFKLNMLGDEHIIDGVHIADPNSSDKVIYCNNKHGITFRNCLNGSYYIDNCNAKFDTCHFEFGEITSNDVVDGYNQHYNLIEFDNCFIWANVKIPTTSNVYYVNCTFYIDSSKNKATNTINDYMGMQSKNCNIRADEVVNNVYARSIIKLDMTNDNMTLPWSGNATVASKYVGGSNGDWNRTKNISYEYTIFPSSCLEWINGSNYTYSTYTTTVAITNTTDFVSFTIDANYRNCFIHCYRKNLDDGTIEVAVLKNNGRMIYDYGSTISGIEWKSVGSVPTVNNTDAKMVNGIMYGYNSANFNGNGYFYYDTTALVVKYKS